MFGLQSIKDEEKNIKNEKMLKELLLKSIEHDAHFEKFYEEHGISKKQLMDFLADPKNFDEQTWEMMQEIRAEINQEIESKLNQIRDPLKTKKTYSDLKSAQQWILVR